MRSGWTAWRDNGLAHLWINPTPEDLWKHMQSTALIQGIMRNMVPMTLDGIARGLRMLGR